MKDCGAHLDASSLKRLAQAKFIQLAMISHQLRHEPSIACKIVADGTRHRPDLYGNSTLEALFARPATLADVFRWEIHYCLHRVARWAQAVAYLEDAEKLTGPSNIRTKTEGRQHVDRWVCSYILSF